MHEKKTEEGNIKNMSIFHDWTSHKKPCDHQWPYSSVFCKRDIFKDANILHVFYSYKKIKVTKDLSLARGLYSESMCQHSFVTSKSRSQLAFNVILRFNMLMKMGKAEVKASVCTLNIA